MAVVYINNATFIDNWANNIALISVSTNCFFSLSNVLFSNSSTFAGGIELMNSVEGSIQNVTFIDQMSVYGPCINLVSLSKEIEIKNVSFLASKQNHQLFHGKVLSLWSSNVLVSSLYIYGIQGKGLVDVQFNSKAEFQEINISEINCLFRSKGCLFFEDANSEMSIKHLMIKNIRTMNSLFYVENSALLIQEMILSVAMIDLQSSEKYFFWFDSSNVTFLAFDFKDVCGKMIYIYTSRTNFTNGVVDNTNMLASVDLNYWTNNFGTSLCFYNMALQAIVHNVTFIKTGFFDYGVRSHINIFFSN